ncbi:hypothetical protein [Chryseobacterium sp. SIMBA_028]|uniref:hypothetical protein n=1 Tax=Chryseobacterium sp. SIMBA_028 TaxID=3085771 RepID=UPI00397A5DA0
MQKTSEKFCGIVSGDPIANYITGFRHPDDIEDFIADLDLTTSGNFHKINDPDYGSNALGSYWFARITPIHFELWQEGHPKKIIPLEDWKAILLSWKECIKG